MIALPRDLQKNESPRIKVIDRIALLEEQHVVIPIPAVKHNQKKKTIFSSDGATVRKFLQSIGEEDQELLPPKLWRLSSKFQERIQERVCQRNTDGDFYSLSEYLDQIDAILYSDTTQLEIEALDVIASTSGKREDDSSFDTESDEEDAEKFGGMRILKEGLQELAAELDSFK